MAIVQLKVGFDNFSYIIYCPETKKTAIVDPSYDASKALSYISKYNLSLEYIIITHHHSDHSSATNAIKEQNPSVKIIASEIDNQKTSIKIDKTIRDKEQLQIGTIRLKFLHTPGHTPDGICIIINNQAIITGDTLFIGNCGRTDLPGGNLQEMYQTLQDKIKPLPDHLIVYPGHDYGDKPFDTLGNQKQTNKTLLAKNLEEFSKIP